MRGCISRGRTPLWAFNRSDTQWWSTQCVLHLVAPTNHLEILLKFCNSGLEWAPSSNTLPGSDNAAGVWTTVLTKIWEILSGRTFQETLLYKGMKKGRGENGPEESMLVRRVFLEIRAIAVEIPGSRWVATNEEIIKLPPLPKLSSSFSTLWIIWDRVSYIQNWSHGHYVAAHDLELLILLLLCS